MNPIELRQRRAQVWEQAKHLLDKVEAENRNLNAEEKDQYDKLVGELNDLKERIDRAEEAEVLARGIETVAESVIRADRGENKNVEARALAAFIRSGNAAEYRAALNGQDSASDADGGVLVPTLVADQIVGIASNLNFIRSLANVGTINGNTNVPFLATNLSASWGGELSEYTPTKAGLNKLNFSPHKLMAYVPISAELTEDGVVDIVSFIVESIASQFADAEEAAFITGDGSGKPTGILAATGGATVGKTTASPTAITDTELIEWIHSVPLRYRSRAVAVVSDSVLQLAMQLKSSYGGYLFQPSLASGKPDTLLGIPLYVSSNVPAVEAGAKVGFVGDLKQYYIRDRSGIVVQRLVERYAEYDQIVIKARKRLDAKLMRTDAVKALQMAAA